MGGSQIPFCPTLHFIIHDNSLYLQHHFTQLTRKPLACPSQKKQKNNITKVNNLYDFKRKGFFKRHLKTVVNIERYHNHAKLDHTYQSTQSLPKPGS